MYKYNVNAAPFVPSVRYVALKDDTIFSDWAIRNEKLLDETKQEREYWNNKYRKCQLKAILMSAKCTK